MVADGNGEEAFFTGPVDGWGALAPTARRSAGLTVHEPELPAPVGQRAPKAL